jgi:hypothetical protein
VALQLPLASDKALRNRSDAHAASMQRDSQRVGGTFSDNNTTGLPTPDDLIRIVLQDTDFVGDLSGDGHLLEAMAENAVDLAADYWSEDNGGVSVPLSTIIIARASLISQAHDMLADRAEDEAEWRRSEDRDNLYRSA